MQKAIQVWKEVAEYQTGEISTLRREIDELKKEMICMERMYREHCFCKKIDENEIVNH